MATIVSISVYSLTLALAGRHRLAALRAEKESAQCKFLTLSDVRYRWRCTPCENHLHPVNVPWGTNGSKSPRTVPHFLLNISPEYRGFTSTLRTVSCVSAKPLFRERRPSAVTAASAEAFVCSPVAMSSNSRLTNGPRSASISRQGPVSVPGRYPVGRRYPQHRRHAYLERHRETRGYCDASNGLELLPGTRNSAGIQTLFRSPRTETPPTLT